MVWVQPFCWRASSPCQHADSALSCPLQAFASVNWVLSEEQFDLETDLAFSFLDYLLLGTSAAPLRRALMESGLGESMIGGGLSGELRQPIFSLGLKGVAPDNADKVSAAATGVCRHTHTPLALLTLSCRCSSSGVQAGVADGGTLPGTRLQPGCTSCRNYASGTACAVPNLCGSQCCAVKHA